MDNLLKFIKIVLMLGLGVLIGQAIYITYHSVEYWESRECKPQIALQAVQARSVPVIEEGVLYGYIGNEPLIEIDIDEDWTNYKAQAI